MQAMKNVRQASIHYAALFFCAALPWCDSAARTALIIVHRLDTLRDADAILVLRGGTIVERGTHRDLLTPGQFYAALYRSHTREAAGTASSPVAVAAGAVA
jgi:hypothetical protein